METLFTVHGGFDMMFQVWTFVALFFNDPDIERLFTLVIVFSAGLGTWLTYVEGIRYGRFDYTRAAKVMAIGLLFYGMFLSDDVDMTLYDDVSNQNATITLPSGLVFISCATNDITVKLETKIWNLSAPIHPVLGPWGYGIASDGAGMRLLRESYEGKMSAIFDQVLAATALKSMNSYMEQCLAVEGAANATVLNALNTGSMQAAMPGGANPAINVNDFYFTAAGGLNATAQSLPCDEANANIAAYIGVATAPGGDFDQVIDTFCNLMAADAAGMRDGGAPIGNECRDVLEESIGRWVTGVASSETAFSANVFLARQWEKMIQSMDSSEAIGRATNLDRVSKELGHKAVVAAEWLPILKNVILMAIIGCLPFLSLFAVTAAGVDALKFTLGLFIWWSLWCVIDVMFLAFWLSHAERTFQIISTGPAYSLDAFKYLWPLASRSLSLLGEMRFYALTLSSAITFGVLKFGGYAIASMGQNLGRSLLHTSANTTTGATNMPGAGEGAVDSYRKSESLGKASAFNKIGSNDIYDNMSSLGVSMAHNLESTRGAMTAIASGGPSGGSMLSNVRDMGYSDGVLKGSESSGYVKAMNMPSATAKGTHRGKGDMATAKATNTAVGEQPDFFNTRAETTAGATMANKDAANNNTGGDVLKASRTSTGVNLENAHGKISSGKKVLAGLGVNTTGMNNSDVAHTMGQMEGLNTGVVSGGKFDSYGGDIDSNGSATYPSGSQIKSAAAGISTGEGKIRASNLAQNFVAGMLNGNPNAWRSGQMMQETLSAGGSLTGVNASDQSEGMFHMSNFHVNSDKAAARLRAITDGAPVQKGDNVSLTGHMTGSGKDLGLAITSMNGNSAINTDHSRNNVSGSSEFNKNSNIDQNPSSPMYWHDQNDGNNYRYEGPRSNKGGGAWNMGGPDSNGRISKQNDDGSWSPTNMPATGMINAAPGVDGANFDFGSAENPNFMEAAYNKTQLQDSSHTVNSGMGVTGASGAWSMLDSSANQLASDNSNQQEFGHQGAQQIAPNNMVAAQNFQQAYKEAAGTVQDNYSEKASAAETIQHMTQGGIVAPLLSQLGIKLGASSQDTSRWQQAADKGFNGDVTEAMLFRVAHSSALPEDKVSAAHAIIESNQSLSTQIANKTDESGGVSTVNMNHAAQEGFGAESTKDTNPDDRSHLVVDMGVQIGTSYDPPEAPSERLSKE